VTYFWADPHFNHSGIIGYCGRKDPWTGTAFRSAGEMNRSLVERWNTVVTRESDVVWVLGDFGFKENTSDGGEDLTIIFHKLRGIKNLVVGNHDEKNKTGLKLPWDNAVPIRDGKGEMERTILPHIVTFRDQGRRAELCHYPLETWKGAHRGALMLHGHSHGSLKRVIPHRFDVGVDVFQKGPVTFDWLWETAQKQSYSPQDHHAEREM
jgi:calcineurin-like phosphoesterase family protein